MTLNASDYVHPDDLPTCDTYDYNENWRDELREEVLSIGREKKQAVSDSEEEEEGEGESDEESPSTITTFREAIDCTC